MAIYKFQEDDVFVNTVTTYPQVEFVIYSGSAYYNNEANISGANISSIRQVPPGYINLYEYNVDRAGYSGADIGQATNTGLIHPFLVKNDTRVAFRTTTNLAYNSASIGAVMEGVYPLSATITKEFYPAAVARQTPSSQDLVDPEYFVTGDVTHLYALKNTLNYNAYLSPHYAYSSSLGDLDTQDVGLISIPSIFYGSEIKKGSVDLRFYITGTLAGRLQDKNRNGELIETVGTSEGSVAGVVLYTEGFVVLTGSWSLNNAVTDKYIDAAISDNPRWVYFAQSIACSTGNGNCSGIPSPVQYPAVSSSFVMNMSGTTKVQTVTMFATAPKGQLNHSNNPTYLSFTTGSSAQTGSLAYIENPKRSIKNIVKSIYNDPAGTFEKTTYISKVGIYDDNQNLIAVAKLANPVKKVPGRDFTFKFKLDI
jgi:hypothetical protein